MTKQSKLKPWSYLDINVRPAADIGWTATVCRERLYGNTKEDIREQISRAVARRDERYAAGEAIGMDVPVLGLFGEVL